MPLERIHKQAFKAAEATHCAGDQGMYWEMHDRLFENQRALEPWSGHAEALGLDVSAFDSCMDAATHAAAIRRDMTEAGKAGVTGTPSFVLGLSDPSDPSRVRGLAFIRGAQPFATFKAQIDSALATVAK
jgi:protein-disulfide isomerase